VTQLLERDDLKIERLERELAAACADNHRYQELIAQAADGMIVHDGDGHFIQANERASDILGYTREELACLSMADIEPDYDSFGIRARLLALKPGEVLSVEGSPRRKDGVPIVLEVRVGLFRMKGVGRQYVAFLRDITSRKETVRALKESSDRFRSLLEETQAHMMRVERLATLGTLSAGVGHELNNLAQIFMGSASLLRAAAAENPQVAVALKALNEASEGVALHAQHLLKSGSMSSTGDERIEIAAFTKATILMLRRAGKLKHVRVEASLPDEFVYLFFNRVKLEQVVINLLINARESLSDSDQGIRIEVRIEGEQLVFKVMDDGQGIAEENLGKIFDPYYTTKASCGGTGLGLLVVREIVREHAGELTVTSRLGVGTTVQFTLPLAGGGSPNQSR
jgi:PAS domain S-box-containing protein